MIWLAMSSVFRVIKITMADFNAKSGKKMEYSANKMGTYELGTKSITG